MSELIRCFAAVDISDRVRQQVRELLGELRRGGFDQIRWVKPELMHLTLVFLGEVSPGFVASAQTRLGQAAARFEPFTGRLSGLGAFPGPARARVIWAGMTEGKAELCRLQRDVASALQAIGYAPEHRPFSPHLTLARLREPTDTSAVVARPFDGEPFAVDRVILFRSVLGPGGPVYTRLAEFPLAAG